MVEWVMPQLDRARELAGVLHRHARRRFPCPDRACQGQLALKRGGGRWFWGCDRYPACKETWPADPETGGPVGEPTDLETRGYRYAVEKALRYWAAELSPGEAGEVRARLCARLGLPPGSDVGQFDLLTCRRALDAVRELHVQARQRESDRLARAAEDFRRAMGSAPLLNEKPSKKKRAAKPVAAARLWDDAGAGEKRRVVLED